MTRMILILGMFFGLNIGSSSSHALYLSVVELTHGEPSKLTVKVFTNDLQDATRNYSDKYVAKSEDEFVEANQELIEDYFKKNLLIQVNGRQTQLEFEKGIKESDAHFLHFKVDADANWKNLEVKGAFFTELFPTQSNIFTMIYKEKKYFGRMTKSEPSVKLSIL